MPPQKNYNEMVFAAGYGGDSERRGQTKMLWIPDGAAKTIEAAEEMGVSGYIW